MADQTSNGVSYGYTRVEPIHDPLCQWANTPTHRDRAKSCPRCALIARIRADERSKFGSDSAFGVLLNEARADERESLRVKAFADPRNSWTRDEVLELLGGDDE